VPRGPGVPRGPLKIFKLVLKEVKAASRQKWEVKNCFKKATVNMNCMGG